MRAYRIAYDGRPFHGFQRQPDVPTVEDAIFDALRALDILEEDAHRPSGYAAAGRTDAGVSALAQTVAFDAPDWLGPRAFNGELPDSVRAWASADAPAEFHATHDATERGYTYFLYAPDADRERAADAVEWLSGERDFHNLTPDGDGTVRTLAGTVERDGEFLVVRLRAGGFPRQFVRRAVTLIESVATDEAGRERIERVLGPKSLPGPEGVRPAPPYPLVLTDVSYPLSFEVAETAAADARAQFRERRVEHATRRRAYGCVERNVE
jgi:tRNA pseudouridine38-40 synthase